MKILITTLGNKKEQMHFLFKTRVKNPTKPKKSTAVAGEEFTESCREVLCGRMTKWTMIHESKICAKKEWNRRVKIKHFTALSISSSFKLLCASVCYFWLMQSSYFTITYQINRKLRALKNLRTAGKGKTSSQTNKDILGKKVSPKPYFWSMTTHLPWCAILTNSTM